MPIKDGRVAFVKQKFDERYDPDEEFLGLDKTVNHIDPLVSVCVSTYQHEEFIEECLNSILAQKADFPFEILIGEDESKDKTRDICKKYAEKHPDKIRLFLRDRKTSNLYDENDELVIRFNVKWLRVSSRGKYIALCEGDDYWTDEYKLQKQIDFMEANPDYSICFHNAKVIYTYKSDQHKFAELEEGEYQGVDIYDKWLIPTASAVFKKECIDNADHFFNINFLFGDIVLFLTLAERGRIWFIDEVMSVYRKHEGSLTYRINDNPKKVQQLIRHEKEICNVFPEKYRKYGNKKLSIFYFILFRKTYKSDFIYSLKMLIQSFFYSKKRSMKLFGKFVKVRLKFF